MILTIWDHLFIIVIGIVFPFYSVMTSRQSLASIHFDFELKRNLYYSNSLILWITAALVCLLWWAQDRLFSWLGFTIPSWNTISFFLTFLVICLYLIDVFIEIHVPTRRKKTIARWKKYTPFLPQTRQEFNHFLFLALSAGICEEIIFRGYFITYLLNLGDGSILSKWAAITIPGVLFGVAHLYQGTKAVLKIIFMAILFGWIFILSKSLIVVIVLHVLIDAVGGWLALNLSDARDMDDEEE